MSTVSQMSVAGNKEKAVDKRALSNKNVHGDDKRWVIICVLVVKLGLHV